MVVADQPDNRPIVEQICLLNTLREHILRDVLQDAKEQKVYKILVLDKTTAKILASCCTMTDVIHENVMFVEDLHKKRQPMPMRDAIYSTLKNDYNLQLILGNSHS